MDDDKRTVIVAALSSYADLLAQNAARLDTEKGKGKAKVTDDDVDLSAELDRNIRLCRQLTGTVASAKSGRDLARGFGPEGRGAGAGSSIGDSDLCELEGTSVYAAAGAAGSHVSRGGHDTTPYINPFTGLTVVPETGYEPGPSNRPPAPPRPASESLALHSKPLPSSPGTTLRKSMLDAVPGSSSAALAAAEAAWWETPRSSQKKPRLGATLGQLNAGPLSGASYPSPSFGLLSTPSMAGGMGPAVPPVPSPHGARNLSFVPQFCEPPSILDMAPGRSAVCFSPLRESFSGLTGTPSRFRGTSLLRWDTLSKRHPRR